jgi:hypothetical protein
MSSCQQIGWQVYKQEALKEGYVPIPPKELFPDSPERGYLDDGVPYLAGNIMKEQCRTSYLQLMQQAAQVQLTRVHQTGGCWSIETAETELPAVPVNDEFRQLVQRWSSAPTWMKLEHCGVDFAGIYISCDTFRFLDEQGDELGRLSIGLENSLICKPEGQNHYDDLRVQILEALGLGE